MLSRIDPLISIVMPARNAASFLSSCLDSIIQQSYTHWELWAINDRSTDQTSSILQSYSQKDSRIHTLNNDGHGIIHALRLAFKNSSGELITRMDADDIMTKNKLADMSQPFLTHQQGILSVGLVKYFSENTLGDGYIQYAEWLNRLTVAENNFSEIYKECSIPSPAWMVHRSDLMSCGAFEPDIYPEDYDLTFRFRRAGLRIKSTHSIVHYWRDHSDRSSRTDDNYKDNRFLKLKVDNFIIDDYKPSQPLVLWGAGKKGKKIAQHLIEHKINFHWLTDNKKKIGVNIYGVVLNAADELLNFNYPQLIVAIAQKDARKEIDARLAAHPTVDGSLSFFFC